MSGPITISLVMARVIDTFRRSGLEKELGDAQKTLSPVADDKMIDFRAPVLHAFDRIDNDLPRSHRIVQSKVRTARPSARSGETTPSSGSWRPGFRHRLAPVHVPWHLDQFGRRPISPKRTENSADSGIRTRGQWQADACKLEAPLPRFRPAQRVLPS